ncbi:MAG: hypothetical protein J6L92_08485 [Clostridia bacterium]|nr:hypothetical protein [Clostridia bacterium]
MAKKKNYKSSKSRYTKKKGILHYLGNMVLNFGQLFFLLWEVAIIVAVPVMFIIFGVLNKLPWWYYIATNGGYLAILALADGLAWLVVTKLVKTEYVPRYKKIAQMAKDVFADR